MAKAKTWYPHGQILETMNGERKMEAQEKLNFIDDRLSSKVKRKEKKLSYDDLYLTIFKILVFFLCYQNMVSDILIVLQI